MTARPAKTKQNTRNVMWRTDGLGRRVLWAFLVLMMPTVITSVMDDTAAAKCECFASVELYLGAFFSQTSPAEHVAPLFCCESYARWDGDARVNGTGQRPGRGRAGHTSEQASGIKTLINDKNSIKKATDIERYSLLMRVMTFITHESRLIVADSTLYYTDEIIRHSELFFVQKSKRKVNTSYKIFTKPGASLHV